MGPNKLYLQLNGEGHKISLEECKDLFDKYKRTFKGAIAWLDSNKALARKQLFMTNIAGRKRRWTAPKFAKVELMLRQELSKKRKGRAWTDDEVDAVKDLASDKVKGHWASIEREGANFMVQSTNVEWTKESMYEIRKACKKGHYDARFYNSVYDETVLDVAEKDAVEVSALQERIMIECGERYCKSVPVLVEGNLKPYWTK